MLEMDKETPETLWAKVGKPYVLQYGAREYKTELTELCIFLLLPAVVGVLVYIGERGWVEYNDTHHLILRYAMCILVHMWLAALVMLHCQFPAVCNKDVCNMDWNWKISVWIFDTFIKFESNFLNWAYAVCLSGLSLLCDGKQLVGFAFPDWKAFANSTLVLIYWVHGGGPYFQSFNDAEMKDILYLYWTQIIFSVAVVGLSQLPGFMCIVQCISTASELILDFVLFVGIWMVRLCVFHTCSGALFFVLDLRGCKATQQYNACKQWLVGSSVLGKIFAGGAHAPAGPQIPTKHNIDQITTELVEAKPGALVWAGKIQSHSTMMTHVRLHCTIKGIPDPKDFELQGVKPVIEAAGIIWNIHSKRLYCQKELRRVGLLA